MECRPSCGACCVAISISSPIPSMPNGKPAGVRCVHLDNRNRCALWGKPERPKICGDFSPSEDFCGGDREEALVLIGELERSTSPNNPNTIGRK